MLLASYHLMLIRLFMVAPIIMARESRATRDYGDTDELPELSLYNIRLLASPSSASSKASQAAVTGLLSYSATTII